MRVFSHFHQFVSLVYAGYSGSFALSKGCKWNIVLGGIAPAHLGEFWEDFGGKTGSWNWDGEGNWAG